PAHRNTFLREVFARDSQRALGQPYTRSRYYHLYLNGHYWGLYMSQERAGADYAETYFGGDSDDYDTIKVEAGPYSVYATNGTIDAHYELHERVKGEITDADYFDLQGKNALGEDEPERVRHIDVENLIDYMMVIFYVGSFDAPLAGTDRANNFYAVRNRETRDAWRFFSHDTEHSMMSLSENRMGPYPAGRLRQYFNPQFLHQQLMQSDAYRLAFADQVQREFFHDGVFTVDAAKERWMARQEEIQLAIIAESARWGDQHRTAPYTKVDWLEETAWVVDRFLETRTETVFKQMERVGLTGDLQVPVFRPDGGLIDDPESFHFRISAGTLFKPQPGEIRYTLDGSDPMLEDGSVSPTALLYDGSGPGVPLKNTAQVRVRLVHEGAWSPLNEVTFIGNGVLATAENLVLSEIMYHPSAPDAGSAFTESDFEFLEFWNPTDAAVDLTGAWFEKGLEFTFANVQLAPDERAVIVRNEGAFAERYGSEIRILGTYGGSGEEEAGSRLSNGGERLLLRNIMGEEIFDFRYNDRNGWPAEAVTAKST
ncbi:MAG: CotH kinase family protein, partial [Verrucomicrobiota bacterium]